MSLRPPATRPPDPRPRPFDLRRILALALTVPLALMEAALAQGTLLPAPPLGLFQGTTDIGAPKHAGRTAYDSDTQEYRLHGAGANMWFSHDEFHFAWTRLKGDFLVRTHARFIGEGVDPHRKLGWMIRSDLTAESPHANASVHGDGLTSLQFRRTRGGDTEEIRSTATAPEVIQLERIGDTYIMAVARFGDRFTETTVTELDLGEEVYVGLCVCSHNAEVVEEAAFWNVRLVRPPAPNFVPYRDYLASNLELLDTVSGRRTLIHRTPDSMQAPNWTPDGQALIYNRNGRLFRFDLASREPAPIDTGFATNNNNDHVLSFDGRWLGISHHPREEGRRSLVYVVPVGGGEPRRITALGPSYLHGWSPDGQDLLYTGERDGEFDIYRIPVAGGDETRLTTAPGLDDGSEYSPDGRFIYFNSVRSGNMQLWRMRPDGSAPEQLTHDELNNWFPHVSPDGQWVAFLSFPGDVRPDDHPFYRQVYLRAIPAAGGEPRVVAYVFGGQGTINVPSWAPDSRRLAFVSNTGAD